MVPGGAWSQGGCMVPGGAWSGRVPGGDPPEATAVGGTHPTGMYSCFELHNESVSLDKVTTCICSRTRFEFCSLSLQLLYFNTHRNVDTLGYAFSELVRYAKYPDLSAGESNQTNDQQISSIPSTQVEMHLNIFRFKSIQVNRSEQ